MTKLSDLGPAHPVTVHAQPGAAGKSQSNFYMCGTCGQMVDKRDLRQVMWHEQTSHDPLELDG